MTSKTANCCIRYMPEQIVGVFDRAQSGKTVQQVLGFGGALPVVGNFEQGLGLGATAVLIGIAPMGGRSEEHTSELQSPCNIVCRLLLERKQPPVHPSMPPVSLH